MLIVTETNTASARTHGDRFFIRVSPEPLLAYICYWSLPALSIRIPALVTAPPTTKANRGSAPGSLFSQAIFREANFLLFPSAHRLAPFRFASQTRPMKALALVFVAAAILFGVYEFYLKKMPVSDSGTAATQAISLTGVRNDLLQIAQAERGYIALNGNCVSLSDLNSSGTLAVEKSARDGYSYEVECSPGADFRVVARHAPAPAGSPIRYPNLVIDQSMQISEVQ
jgi:hypothetical protein